jgi:hypothetical protein
MQEPSFGNLLDKGLYSVLLPCPLHNRINPTAEKQTGLQGNC